MNAINWNASIMFPSDSCFINRFTKVSHGPSKSSGNLMYTIESEVVQPESYNVGGQEVNIAGVKAIQYFVTKVFKDDGEVDEDKTAEARSRVFGPSTNLDQLSLFEKLGLSVDNVDPESPPTDKLEGILVYAQMSANIQEQRKTPTSEEIAKAKKSNSRPEGAIMKHPVSGKALVKYWPKIDEIFGVAPSATAKAY